MSAHRIVRRLGAIALLLTWSQVATANAIPCAIWCEIAGGINAGQLVHGDHGHAEQSPHHDCNVMSVGGADCGAPQLLVVSAVEHDALRAPTTVETVGDAPVAVLQSFISSSQAAETPPPRV